MSLLSPLNPSFQEKRNFKMHERKEILAKFYHPDWMGAETGPISIQCKAKLTRSLLDEEWAAVLGLFRAGY